MHFIFTLAFDWLLHVVYDLVIKKINNQINDRKNTLEILHEESDADVQLNVHVPLTFVVEIVHVVMLVIELIKLEPKTIIKNN